jgi:hypothetical protein
MATRNSNQNVIAGLLVALLALAGLNIYQYINRNSLVAANKQQETELIELDKAKTELDKEYYEALSDLEEMKSSNAELNQIIDGQKEELQKQKNRISGLLKDSKNLKAAKEEIAKLREQAEQYVAEITVLREENEKLSSDNTVLRQTNTSLMAEVDTVKQRNQKLSQVKNVLEKENEDLSQAKETLSKKVNMASTVEVDDLEIKGYEREDDGDSRRKRRAENVDFLKICFTTLPNELASNPEETFFVRIIDPIGETVAVDNRGSGVTKIGMENTPVRYSTVIKTAYDQSEDEVCGEWSPGIKLREGTYIVEVYNKGFLAGEGKFRLR